MQISKHNFHLHTLHPSDNGSLRWPVIKCLPYKPADTSISPKAHRKVEGEASAESCSLTSIHVPHPMYSQDTNSSKK